MFHLNLAQKIKIKRILNIAIPSGLQGAFDMLSVLIALFFLGNISPLNFTALGLGANYVIVFYPLSAVFGVGTNVLMARRFGAKNYVEMNVIYSTMTYASLLFSIPILLIAFLCIPAYLNSLNIKPELYHLTYSYVSLTIFALPAIIIKNVLISGFAAIGDTKRPFYIKIVLTCLSILGYIVLIDGKFGFPRLELFGAAIVTLTISYLELIALLVLPKIVQTTMALKMQWNSTFLRNALKIGIPTSIERAFTICSLNIVLIFVGYYADIYHNSAMTGFQAGTKIEGFSFVPGFGFMVAVMSLMGQSIGAKNYKLGEEYTKIGAILASIILAICGLCLAIFAKPLSNIFIEKDSIAVQISIAYLIAVGFSQIPLILCFVYDGALRGAGFSKIPLFINVSSISLFRLLPMWICASLKCSIYSLFIIIFIETYIRAIIFYFVFKSGIWKKTKEL